jgi:hypothetical protein
MFPDVTLLCSLQDLELYDPVVDVRCYELAALFLCSVYVPKCGPAGQFVRPCMSICYGKGLSTVCF